MNWKGFVSAALLCLLASPAFGQPELSVTPGGIQGGNFVWDVSITPDLSLPLDGTTPLAVEIGFRLRGAPLISANNVNPTEFDTPNPGTIIFGWETRDPTANNNPVGLQVNTDEGEIFAAFGSIDFTTPGPKPFLQIITLGPANGGGPISTIRWLGAYAVGHGRIAQMVGVTGENFDEFRGFDLYGGLAVQAIPEPASAALLAFASVIVTLSTVSRRSRRTTHG